MVHSAPVPATTRSISKPRRPLFALRSLHPFEATACCFVLLCGCASSRERTASRSDSETSSLPAATTSFDSTNSDSLAAAFETASAPSSETAGETTAETTVETAAEDLSELTSETTSPLSSDTAMGISTDTTGASTSGSSSDTGSSSAADPSQSSCANPIPLQCGDRLNHSTLVNGQADQVYGYGCSARLESGRETIYLLTTAERCEVEVRLTELEVDLDLFSVEECGVLSRGECSSTPLDLQDGEHIGFSTVAGVSLFIMVDGYAGAEGSYALEVDCTCGD